MRLKKVWSISGVSGDSRRASLLAELWVPHPHGLDEMRGTQKDPLDLHRMTAKGKQLT